MGQWRGTVNLGDGAQRSSTGGNGGLDIFIVKYNAQGGFLWAKSIGGSAYDMAYGVAVDSANNIIVTGGFGLNQMVTSVDFGGGPLSGPGGQEIFVAKYSPNGGYLWAKAFGGPFNDYGYAVQVDSSDNIIVGGVFDSGPIDFGGGPISGAGAFDAFLLKLNSGGGYVWAKRFGGAGADVLKTIAVDRAGDVYAVGYYSGIADFGGGLAPAVGPNACFVAKYSGANGVYRWSRTFGSVNSAAGYGVATDPNNADVVVSGTLGSGTDFGGGAITTAGGKAMFIARYSTTGTYVWGKSYGGDVNSTDIACAVAVDAGGRIAVTGQVQSAVDFGGGWLYGNGLINHFVLDLTSAGQFQWAKRCENTSGASYGLSAWFDPSGDIVTSGAFEASVDFGGGAVNTGGASKGVFTASFTP